MSISGLALVIGAGALALPHNQPQFQQLFEVQGTSGFGTVGQLGIVAVRNEAVRVYQIQNRLNIDDYWAIFRR